MSGSGPPPRKIRNGMPASDLSVEWRNSSGPNGGTCLDYARLDGPSGGPRVAVRQSTDPAGPALIFDREAFRDFLTQVKAGGADWLLS